MDSERNLEGSFSNEPPFFDNNNFIEWKTRFESYMKSIDHDLQHVISIGDFQPMETNFESQNEFFKRKFCKNLEAKVIIYKSFQRVEYERIFFCETANGIWKNLLNFHQRNCQAKDDDISLEVLFTY